MRQQRTIVDGPCEGSWSKEGSMLGFSSPPGFDSVLADEADPYTELPWSAGCLSRPIDWRWVVAQERPREQFADSELGVAQRYLNAIADSGGFTRVEADVELQAMHDAWSIWDGRRWPRMELESRVLARHSSEEIAEMMQISVESVRLYEALFFDVRDRREAEGFMYPAVLGGSDVGSPQRPLYDVVKRLAYGGGPVILDYALRAAQATPEELEGDDDDTDLLRLFRLRLIMEQVPMNRVTGPHLLRFPAERRRSQSHWLKAALRMLDDAYANIDLVDADLWPALRKVYVENGLRELISEHAVEAESCGTVTV